MLTGIQSDKSVLSDYYSQAEENFARLIRGKNLDKAIQNNPNLMNSFEEILSCALIDAYRSNDECVRAHLFLQRILYYINRLKLFWFDDFDNYINENSFVLSGIKSKIETGWVAWEEKHIEKDVVSSLITQEALGKRVKEDLNPFPSKDTLFLRNDISLTGYKRLLAITSLDGLVEASQLSRVLGGVGNDIQLMLTKIFWEEYGGGKLSRKHSSHFINMLNECDMKTQPEAYFDVVPWEVLANINHSFELSERKQNYLRYVGGLLYVETSAPASFQNFQKAGERIGLGEAGTAYWRLHMSEDIRHGQWMLSEVALPLAKQYENKAWQIVYGYDQQKFISARAIKSIVKSISSLDDY